ncbi:hypothetical protein ACLOJK_020918 [Asimina triloba]
MGSLVTGANVEKIAGLNTLGVSMSLIDYAPRGLNPPHTHPRATEMVFVLYGELKVGFITTANVLISKRIKQGENFVFPRGLVHFQKNDDDVPAAVIAAFNSQLPGTQSIAVTLFASTPPVPNNVLTKAFQVGTKEVEKIKSRTCSFVPSFGTASKMPFSKFTRETGFFNNLSPIFTRSSKFSLVATSTDVTVPLNVSSCIPSFQLSEYIDS